MKNKKLDKLDDIILNPQKGIVVILGMILMHIVILAGLFVVTSILCPNKVSIHKIPLIDAVPSIFSSMDIIPAFTMKDHFAFFLAILILIAFIVVFELPLIIMMISKKEEADSGMSILLILAVLEAILFVYEYHWVWNVDISTEYIIKGILVGAVLLYGNFIIMSYGHFWGGIICNIILAICAIFVFNYIFWGFIVMAIVIYAINILMKDEIFWLWLIFRR